MNSNIRIEKLILNNFRNHKYLKLDITKNIVLIYGQNGSGKTSVLESISLFDSSNGFRASNLGELVNDDYKGPLEMFGVNILIRDTNNFIKAGIGLKKIIDKYKKIISIDEKKNNKEIIKKIPKIYSIVPKMTFLFQGNSEERRNFLDQMIFIIEDNHKKNILNYNKYKNERIKILKKWKINNEDWLDAVEKKMVSHGLIICDNRRNFLKKLNFILDDLDIEFSSFQVYLNGELDELLLEKPAIEVEEIFLSTLKRNRENDLITGRTHYGINKTDMIVKEKKSFKEAKTFSTGQQKTILFSLIFSFIKYLEMFPDKKAIFLLDDVFSYLDKNFISLVIEKLNELNVQTWLTDVKGDWVFENKTYKAIIDKINIDDKRFKLNQKKI
ncbi:MAG: AAA family ATPase [Alphaproteobacteria bacterium]